MSQQSQKNCWDESEIKSTALDLFCHDLVGLTRTLSEKRRQAQFVLESLGQSSERNSHSSNLPTARCCCPRRSTIDFRRKRIPEEVVSSWLVEEFTRSQIRISVSCMKIDLCEFMDAAEAPNGSPAEGFTRTIKSVLHNPVLLSEFDLFAPPSSTSASGSSPRVIHVLSQEYPTEL